MDKHVINEYCQIIKNKILQCEFGSALNSVSKLLSHFPRNAQGYYYKGVCEFAKEQYIDSVASYQTAIKLNPTYARAYFNLGVCYFELEYYDFALISIGKALVLFSKQKDLAGKRRCIEALRTIESERIK